MPAGFLALRLVVPLITVCIAAGVAVFGGPLAALLFIASLLAFACVLRAWRC